MSKLKYNLVLVTEESSKAKRTEGDTAGDFTFGARGSVLNSPIKDSNSRKPTWTPLVSVELGSEIFPRKGSDETIAGCFNLDGATPVQGQVYERLDGDLVEDFNCSLKARALCTYKVRRVTPGSQRDTPSGTCSIFTLGECEHSTGIKKAGVPWEIRAWLDKNKFIENVGMRPQLIVREALKARLIPRVDAPNGAHTAAVKQLKSYVSRERRKRSSNGSLHATSYGAAMVNVRSLTLGGAESSIDQ